MLCLEITTLKFYISNMNIDHYRIMKIIVKIKVFRQICFSPPPPLKQPCKVKSLTARGLTLEAQSIALNGGFQSGLSYSLEGAQL